MKFNCVDTGPVAAYGNPKNVDDAPKFVDYVRGYEAFPKLKACDLVFDDGRSRVAVAYQAYHLMNSDSVLLMHDMTTPPITTLSASITGTSNSTSSKLMSRAV